MTTHLGWTLLVGLGCWSCKDFTASETERGGVSGATGEGGHGNGSGNEPTVVAFCSLLTGGFSTQSVETLAVSMSGDGAAAVVYAWDEPASTVFYNVSQLPAGDYWGGWRCLESLPGVTRLTAMNLANQVPEVFALSETGALFARRDGSDGWSPWLPFSLPSSASRLSDVAALKADVAHVFVVDRGQVAVRSRVDVAPYSDYGPWQRLESNDALLVTAVVRRDDRQQVITVDATGQWQTALRPVGDDAFGSWTDLPSPPEPSVDHDAVDSGTLVAYALDATGTIWENRDLPDAAWQKLSVPNTYGPITAIAAKVIDDTPHLFAVDAAGNVFVSGIGE